jgi:hypothetical protein
VTRINCHADGSHRHPRKRRFPPTSATFPDVVGIRASARRRAPAAGELDPESPPARTKVASIHLLRWRLRDAAIRGTDLVISCTGCPEWRHVAMPSSRTHQNWAVSPNAASLRSAATQRQPRAGGGCCRSGEAGPRALTLRELEARTTTDLGPIVANDRDPDLASISRE